MKRILILIAALLTAVPCLAEGPIQCLPSQVGGTGLGYVRADGPAGEWAAWWCPQRWYHRRNYFVRPPGQVIVHPATSGMSQLAIVRAYMAANPMGGDCAVPGASVRALCAEMTAASWGTLPPLPEMVVAKATAADGTRPAYKLDAAGKLISAAPVRATAGAPCSCAWWAVASGSTDYCSITQPRPASASLLAACVRK